MTGTRLTQADSIVPHPRMTDQIPEATADDSLMPTAGLCLTEPWWETAHEAFRNNGRATVTGTGLSWRARRGG